ncbi:MAG: hypothetical protein AMJ54_10450 [Deltaproteobacteria bacterium SG8_13]|nr:MAG: hypothetical protein AMJ54_10450 [Deltaproteobacteria bacterium SG8_13]
MDSEQDRSDRRIIRQVWQGHTQAFARLVDSYKGPVFNLALRMTASRQDAEDLAQETFLKAYLGLKRFKPDGRFFPWLFTIAVNTVRNHLKKNPPVLPARWAAGAQDLPAGPDSDPQRQLEDKQQRSQIAGALQRLSIEQREAVVLRYYQDLSFDDIAAVCAVPVSTAKMRVYRGIQRLSTMLDEMLLRNADNDPPEKPVKEPDNGRK